MLVRNTLFCLLILSFYRSYAIRHIVRFVPFYLFPVTRQHLMVFPDKNYIRSEYKSKPMIRTFGIVGAAALAITVLLSLWSISAHAQLTLSSNVSRINNATRGQEGLDIYPKVTITSPTKNSSLPVGVTIITGTSSARL